MKAVTCKCPFCGFEMQIDCEGEWNGCCEHLAYADAESSNEHDPDEPDFLPGWGSETTPDPLRDSFKRMRDAGRERDLRKSLCSVVDDVDTEQNANHIVVRAAGHVSSEETRFECDVAVKVVFAKDTARFAADLVKLFEE